MKLKKVVGRWPFKLFDVKSPSTKLTEFIRLMAIPDDKTKGEFYRIANQKLAPKLYSEKFIDGIRQKDVGLLIDKTFNETKTSDIFKKHFYCDISLANAHSMTYTSDITGMANSIEIRSPFLDHELFLFGGNVPTKFKLRSYFSRKYNKYIMKKAAESFLPEEIIYAKKMGFGYNIKLHQLMRNELKNETEIRLFRGNLEKTGLFKMDFVRECFEEHVSGRKNHGELLLGLVCVDEWIERFMK